MSAEFDGRTGAKPQTEARRYVYRVLATIIVSERTDADGWFYGGITNEFDRRRLKKALEAVRIELVKKAGRAE